MRKDKALKTMVFAVSTMMLASIPTIKAKAADYILPEQGVAGIAYSLDNYYSASKDVHTGSADKLLTEILMTKIVSPYANLGVSVASNYVNVRSEPSTESEVVGKLYRGCAADILEYLEDDWVKIVSGDVEGYIAANYLAIGKEAEKMIDEYATIYATVTTETLRVREEQSTESKILTLIPQGETYIVLKEYDEWIEILLGEDEENDFSGFISKDYVDIEVEFEYAISIEEENRRIAAEEEAKRAEEERLARLAAEEAARKAEEKRKAEEAAKKAAEAAKKAAEAAKGQKEQSSSKESSSSSSSSSKDLSSLRKEIATYAQKFVGNPYVWGGESLTKGADCSGFVQTIYRQFGYKIPRVSRDQAKGAGKQVNLSDRQPGDLIFYTNSSGVVNHVAMYIGNDKIVHAANSRQGIIISKYNYRNVYRIRRVVY